jgi:hypothetical protein
MSLKSSFDQYDQHAKHFMLGALLQDHPILDPVRRQIGSNIKSLKDVGADIKLHNRLVRETKQKLDSSIEYVASYMSSSIKSVRVSARNAVIQMRKTREWLDSLVPQNTPPG